MKAVIGELSNRFREGADGDFQHHRYSGPDLYFYWQFNVGLGMALERGWYSIWLIELSPASGAVPHGWESLARRYFFLSGFGLDAGAAVGLPAFGFVLWLPPLTMIDLPV